MEGNIIVYLQNSKGLSENLLLKNSVGWIKKIICKDPQPPIIEWKKQSHLKNRAKSLGINFVKWVKHEEKCKI